MDKRYQVFISSTYEDLKHERDAVIKAVLEMGHFPVGMEMFNAADEEQWVTIQREIDRSDYYLLIVAHRYGSTIAAEGGISYTEKEFDYAVSTGVPRIGFEIAKGASWDPAHVDDGRKKKRLDAFKGKVRTRPVDFWTSKEDLATKVVLSLGKMIPNTDRPGWQRGGKTSDDALAIIARLTDDNIRLQEENARLRMLSTPIPQLEFFFSDDKGESLGDTLFVDLSDMNAYNDKLNEGISELRRMISRYDTTRKGGRAGYYPTKNHFPVKIPRERIDKLVSRLERYEISDIPTFQFSNLYTDSNPSYSSTFTKPTGGLDYANYIVFTEIEAHVTDMVLKARAYSQQKNRLSYIISCRNAGRTAAEHVQIDMFARAKFMTMAGAVNAENIDARAADHTGSIEMLIPHNKVEVARKSIHKSIATGELLIDIQALGKNIPEPQKAQLKIVFDGSRPPTVVR